MARCLSENGKSPTKGIAVWIVAKKAELESKRISARQNKSLIPHKSIEPPKKPKKKKSNMKSIAEIDRLAKEERLSYGYYVAKYGV